MGQSGRHVGSHSINHDSILHKPNESNKMLRSEPMSIRFFSDPNRQNQRYDISRTGINVGKDGNYAQQHDLTWGEVEDIYNELQGQDSFAEAVKFLNKVRVEPKEKDSANCKILIPNDAVQNIYNKMSVEDRLEIIRLGAKDKFPTFSNASVLKAYKESWNNTTGLIRELFSNGIRTSGTGKMIINYVASDKKPTNMKHGYHSSRTGKWYSWDVIET